MKFDSVLFLGLSALLYAGLAVGERIKVKYGGVSETHAL